MADAHASGACIRTGVRVQIPFSASQHKKESRDAIFAALDSFWVILNHME